MYCRLTRSDIELWDHLFNRDDLLFTCEKCISDYSVPVTPGDCVKVLGVILSGVCMLFKSQPRINIHQLPLLSPTDTPIGKICFPNHPCKTIDL